MVGFPCVKNIFLSVTCKYKMISYLPCETKVNWRVFMCGFLQLIVKKSLTNPPEKEKERKSWTLVSFLLYTRWYMYQQRLMFKNFPPHPPPLKKCGSAPGMSLPRYESLSSSDLQNIRFLLLIPVREERSLVIEDFRRIFLNTSNRQCGKVFGNAILRFKDVGNS